MNIVKTRYSTDVSHVPKSVLRELEKDNPEYLKQLQYTPYAVTAEKTVKGYTVRNNRVELPLSYSMGQKFTDKRITVPRKFSFLKTLRPEQEKFITEVGEDYENCPLLVAPCGTGKTVMGMYFAAKLGQKTLVLAPKSILVGQFIKSAKFFTDAKVASIDSSDKAESVAAGNDIVVCTYQMVLLCNTSKFVESFGTIIFDEIHRTGAETLLPTLYMFPARYRIGMTATLRRKDKLETLIIPHFLCQHDMDAQRKCKVEFRTLKNSVFNGTTHDKEGLLEKAGVPFWKGKNSLVVGAECSQAITRAMFSGKLTFLERQRLQNELGKPMASRLETYSSEYTPRNDEILKVVQAVLWEGRKVLVLGKRIEQLEYMHSKLGGILLTGQKYRELKRDMPAMERLFDNATLIFGIDKIAEEGLDVPKLDTLIMLSPVTDPEQLIGRITRVLPGKRGPLAIIFRGENPLWDGMIRKSLPILEKFK